MLFKKKLAQYDVKRRPGQEKINSKFTIVLSKDKVCFLHKKLTEYDVKRRPGQEKSKFTTVLSKEKMCFLI